MPLAFRKNHGKPGDHGGEKTRKDPRLGSIENIIPQPGIFNQGGRAKAGNAGGQI
jgi:hypothetical protein